MIVDGFDISNDGDIYLIAEMSANHNGNIENAIKTIEAAKAAGANAIKIQTYTPDTLTIRSKRPEFYLSGGLWDGRHLYDLYQDASTRIIKYAWKQYYETAGSTSARTYDVRGKVYYPITSNNMEMGSANGDGAENYLLIKEYKA